MPEPPCCGCAGWVFSHIVQTVAVTDDRVAIGAEAGSVMAMAAGLDSPPTSTKLKTNKLAMRRFTLSSVVGHSNPGNPTASVCYSRHSAMTIVTWGAVLIGTWSVDRWMWVPILGVVGTLAHPFRS